MDHIIEVILCALISCCQIHIERYEIIHMREKGALHRDRAAHLPTVNYPALACGASCFIQAARCTCAEASSGRLSTSVTSGRSDRTFL